MEFCNVTRFILYYCMSSYHRISFEICQLLERPQWRHSRWPRKWRHNRLRQARANIGRSQRRSFRINLRPTKTQTRHDAMLGEDPQCKIVVIVVTNVDAILPTPQSNVEQSKRMKTPRRPIAFTTVCIFFFLGLLQPARSSKESSLTPTS